MHVSWLDAILPHWREKETWLPAYISLAIFLIWKFKKAGLFLILAAILCVGTADFTSSQLIKKNVERLRPCNNAEIKTDVQLLVRCGSGYSFTSSHAANHFALATFLALTLGRVYRRIRVPLWLWAASIALSQVYVGVHYPLDIIFGGLLGMMLGNLFYSIWKRYALPLKISIQV